MIILQILAGLLLIPLTILLVLVFNIYFRNWIFWLAMVVDMGIYAFFWGLLWRSTNNAILMFVILCIAFYLRRNYLAEKIDKENFPVLYAKVRRKKFLVDFVFLLSCLNIFKYLPEKLNNKIVIKTAENIKFSAWLEQVLLKCKGAQIYILDDESEINFEIK